MNEIILETDKLYKNYDKKNDVLKNISFKLEKGEFVSLMGPSGAGKSTFLNCISTLDVPSRGKVYIFGKNLITLSSKEISDFRYKSLGFIFQNMNLLESMTIFDNIAVPLILAKVKNSIIEKKVLQIARKLNIENLLNKYPSMCSGGEIQRIAIARAIINDPQLIIADEPTGNLDTENSKIIMSILSSLNKTGVSIILVTHDNVVASFSKKLLYMKDGSIISKIDRHEKSQKEYLERINDLTDKDSLISILE